ncbi:hypothetical protein FRC08_011006 [Ceratobasidium sp. 394]|nr:hypothetical protein FRC08_011006 [Ceratobasidium sp. 394]
MAISLLEIPGASHPNLYPLPFAMLAVTSTGPNVYSGDNALVDFYDPDNYLRRRNILSAAHGVRICAKLDKCPPVPLVEAPKHPWRSHGVRIYAKLMSSLPAANVKPLPAPDVLSRAREEGQSRISWTGHHPISRPRSSGAIESEWRHYRSNPGRSN